MAQYMTKQRRELIAFLTSNAHKYFSAREIADHLQDKEVSISAVYRNLSVLEEAGYISRITRDGSREIYYRCLNFAVCRNSIHLMCTKCGETFHMNMEESERMLESVIKNDNFQISKQKTVLYGICKKCHR